MWKRAVFQQDGRASVLMRMIKPLSSLWRDARGGTPPGLTLAVVKDDRLVYARGFGQADTPRGLAATADTAYGWWSMTKLVTAAAIVQLQEQGKLSIDDPISRHLPFFAVSYPSAASRPITIRDLLNRAEKLKLL